MDMTGHETAATVSSVSGTAWRSTDQLCSVIERNLPEEVAVAITVANQPAAVVIASPSDFQDLGWGFAVTEGLAHAADIEGCAVSRESAGVRLTLKLSTLRGAMRERLLPGRASCGLCGVRDLNQAIRPVPRVVPGGAMARDVLHRAMGALDAKQPLNNLTHAVHAAAHITFNGEFTAVREDVGRHNALDKLIGALSRARMDPADGAVLLTSRASYEMIDKAAMAGVRILAAISAPSALALRKAETAGMTLVGIARHDGFVTFCGDERLDRNS